MSVVKQIREPRVDYLALEKPALLRGFELLATAEGGVAKLRELILSLATQGKLAHQDHSDEPATTLLRRIAKMAGRAYTSLPTDRLPEGWAATTFGEYALALCTGPFGSLIGKDEYIEGGIPLINPSHMKNGRIEAQSNISVLAVKANDLKAYALRSGDIVFARRGDVGRTAIVSDKEDGWLCGTGSFFARFHPDVDREFVQMIFNSEAMRSYLGAGAIGTTMVNLNQRLLLNAPLHIPPLAEQHRIVACVEELMTLCDELEARGRLADEQHARLTATLFDALTASDSAQTLADNWQRIAAHFDLLLDRPQAIDALEQTILQLAVRGLLVPQDASDEPASKLLSRIRAHRERRIAKGELKRDKPLLAVTSDEEPFPSNKGWLWTRITELCEVQGGIQKTPLRRPVKNHYPYLRVANVQRNALQLDEIEQYELADDEVEKWRLRSGDLLVVEGNGSEDEIGRCAIWDGSIDPCVFQNHLIRVRPDVASTVEFLKLFLNSPDGTAEMKRLAITTSGLFNLSVGKIRNIPVPLPPLSEQQRIVARVEQLRSLCDDLRGRLNKVRATQIHLAEALVTEAVQPQRGVRLG